MSDTALISAPCALYACRFCRTKTGWTHQAWCPRSGTEKPGCEDCRYQNAEKGSCAHPARRKGGGTE